MLYTSPFLNRSMTCNHITAKIFFQTNGFLFVDSDIIEGPSRVSLSCPIRYHFCFLSTTVLRYDRLWSLILSILKQSQPDQASSQGSVVQTSSGDATKYNALCFFFLLNRDTVFLITTVDLILILSLNAC